MDNVTKARREIDRRIKEFRTFDALPEAERRQLREQGLDPHENRETRAYKQSVVKKKVTDSIFAKFGDNPKKVKFWLGRMGLSGDGSGYTVHTTGDLEAEAERAAEND